MNATMVRKIFRLRLRGLGDFVGGSELCMAVVFFEWWLVPDSTGINPTKWRNRNKRAACLRVIKVLLIVISYKILQMTPARDQAEKPDNRSNL